MTKLLILAAVLISITTNVNAKFSSELYGSSDAKTANIDFSDLFENIDLNIPPADHPHAHMNVTGLVSHYGYKLEIHDIVTSNGYILQFHRIVGKGANSCADGKPAVLLQHGLLGSSMDWVITGPERGLGFLLADAGYDVWMGNARGNRYSREHNTLSIRSPKYWDFSWHELGADDLPVVVDYILEITRKEKIFYVGFSQGTTTFFVMLSEHPQYNEKITAMIALAPVAYCSRMTSPVFRALGSLASSIYLILKVLGQYEFKPSGEFFKRFAAHICKEDTVTYPICTNVLFLISGYSQEQLDSELLPAILAHTPAGASTKQLVHYAQLIKTGRFRKYDFGIIKNLIEYRKIKPPAYKLENVKVPVALLYSVNDWVADPKDVDQLFSEISNPIGKIRVADEKFNHLDFLWGKDVKPLLYDKLLNLLFRYKD